MVQFVEFNDPVCKKKETGDEDVRKNLGAIPSAKAVNPHQQQQSYILYLIYYLIFWREMVLNPCFLLNCEINIVTCHGKRAPTCRS